MQPALMAWEVPTLPPSTQDLVLPTTTTIAAVQLTHTVLIVPFTEPDTPIHRTPEVLFMVHCTEPVQPKFPPKPPIHVPC